jgi:hypothetical protein
MNGREADSPGAPYCSGESGGCSAIDNASGGQRLGRSGLWLVWQPDARTLNAILHLTAYSAWWHWAPCCYSHSTPVAFVRVAIFECHRFAP